MYMAASFAIDLIIKEKTFVVTECHYSLGQPTDVRGRAIAGTRSGIISLSITGADYQILSEWGINPTKAYDGEILYKDTTNKNALFKTISFVQGYCVQYDEEFTPHSGVVATYQFHLGVTAAKMYLNGVLHDNMWSDWKFGE